MARSAKLAPESPPAGPGPWIISFNDCMTNLLCFFVLLTSFSSFTPASKGRISGAFRSMANPSLFSGLKEVKDSVIQSPDRPFDPTEQGSEKPTDLPPVAVQHPSGESVPFGAQAHNDRLAIRMPCSQLFWAEGSRLKPSAKHRLKLLGALLALQPRQVIVRVVVPRSAAATQNADAARERAWSVIEFLAASASLPLERFLLGGADGQAASSVQEDLVEILLLNGNVYK